MLILLIWGGGGGEGAQNSGKPAYIILARSLTCLHQIFFVTCTFATKKRYFDQYLSLLFSSNFITFDTLIILWRFDN